MEYGRLILRRADTAILEPVTKIGGTPVWVDKPNWPRSRSTGELMLFLGQVVIEPRLFGVEPGRIAYIFMTYDEECGLETCDPELGENAVVIQQMSPERPVMFQNGPTLMEIIRENGGMSLRPLELAATLSIEDEIPDVDPEEVPAWEEVHGIKYYTALSQRVGGAPDWIQADEAAPGWRLLLQIGQDPMVGEAMVSPDWNFGTGELYVLLSPDCLTGRVIWQC